MSGARYRVVSGTDEDQREKGVAERDGEDTILNHARRGKLLDLARNAARNNPTFATFLKQFDLNAVGNEGGKAVITFSDGDYAKEVREQFARWTRNADFFDGLNFNTVLKIILKTELIGGDLVLLFDDNLIEDSGRILVYEPDEIGNTTPAALEARYGKGAVQRLGRVYTPNGQFQGVVVSRSQRGQDEFDPRKSYFLKKDPNESSFKDLWLMPRNVFRIAQGRGVTPVSSSLSTIIDLHDYLSFEIASAKKNAQTLAQVTQDIPDDAELPSAFDSDADFSNMTDEEIEEAAKAEEDSQVPTVTLDKIQAAGCVYQVLPEGYKLELLDTKRPNINAIEFVRWLAAQSASPLGLTNVYATLKCDTSYTAFRGEQLMAQPAFEEAQHFLEQICDWCLYRWSRWAIRKGIIEDRFEGEEEDWIRKVSWNWPRMKDVDVVKEQNAIALKLKNGTGSYAEIYGADWRERLEQIAEEIRFCKEHGLQHPSAMQTAPAVQDEDEQRENNDSNQREEE